MVYLGTDHAGFDLKEAAKTYLAEHNVAFTDMGDTKPDPNDDYPDFAIPVAEKVGQGSDNGILFCESAGGMSIAANKVKGARAVVCQNRTDVVHAKEHNNANIMVISHMHVSIEQLPQLINTWMTTPFTNEDRHLRRLAKIAKYEEEHWK